jgi:hypothetical protein
MRNLLSPAFQLLFCLCIPFLAHANCLTESVLKAAVNSGYEKGNNELIACKALPSQQDQIIAAFARETGEHKYQLTVLIVSNETGKTIHQYIDDDPSFGAAGDPVHLTIDTGQYFVAPNRRAFGVRVIQSLNSWDSEEFLNLFLPEESNLARILANLRTSSSSMRDCFDGHQMKRLVSVSKDLSEGFYSLVVKTSEQVYEPVMHSDATCSSKETTRSYQTLLRFRNGSYHAPKEFY